MPIRDILLLGNPRLYERCAPVEPGEVVVKARILIRARTQIQRHRPAGDGRLL